MTEFPFAGYRSIIAESFYAHGEQSSNAVRIRPVSEESFPRGIRVESSRKLRDTSVYPLGTKFRLRVKVKKGGTHLYCGHRDKIEVVQDSPSTQPERDMQTARKKLRSGILTYELSESEEFNEGTVKQVTVNKYERDPKARLACIEHHGTSCSACGFEFRDAYGAIGRGFIHVHHLVPLSSIKQDYVVDPVEDLRPVCPNCHSMLHRKVPPFDIEELQSLMKKS
jgi:hypothetical protein